MEEKGNSFWTSTFIMEHSLLIHILILLLHIFLTSTMAQYPIPWLSLGMTTLPVNITTLRLVVHHALQPLADHFHPSTWVTLLVQVCVGLSLVTTIRQASILK